MPVKHTKELLKLYLRGECSPEEQQEIEALLLLPEGAVMLREVLDESWEELRDKNTEDNTQHYARFREKYKLGRSLSGPLADKKKASIFRNTDLLKYAAILLCIASMGIMLSRGTLNFSYRQQVRTVTEELVEYANPRGQTSTIILPDSTKVYLGAESSIRFGKKLEGKKREIYLKGEAFFDVVHLKDRPFVVQTGSVHTIVLGTSFKVDAHASRNISISVATGKVSVANTSGKKYRNLSVLYPGEKLTWNPVKQEFFKSHVPVSELWAWKNGGLVFRDQSLADISGILERAFDVRIKTDTSLSSKRLSASFARTSIREILEVLAYTGKFSYSLKDRDVEIKRK